MNKKVSLGTTLALIALAIALAVTLTMTLAMRHFSATVTDVNQRQALLDYLTEVDKQVRSSYDGDIDENALREAVAAAYVSGIGDPYAEYLSAQRYSDQQAALTGIEEGFGFQFVRQPNGDLSITVIDNGSPAAMNDVMVGDIIRTVNGQMIGDEMTATTLQGLLKTAGKLQLTVTRGDKDYSFSLVSAVYTKLSVFSEMKNGNVGYIKITSFTEATPTQFKTAVETLKSSGATAFVFDVRGNRGGSFTAVQDILGYLMPRGVYATLTKSDKVISLTSSGTTELNDPTVTLIDAQTYGEAELFAGVLSEHQKTKLVGLTTAGCAMVQEYFAITSTNARIKLSTGQLSLPIGGSWQGVGIVPAQMVYSVVDEDGVESQLQEALIALGAATQTTVPTTTTTAATATTTADGETAQTTASEE